MKERTTTFDSAVYWNERYASGGNSGAGSYNRLAEFKASVLNAFVEKEHIQSVIEWGCGDGKQLRLAHYPRYYGYDVSQEAVQKCRRLFKADKTKRFVWSGSKHFTRFHRAELALSLDVLYHLVEDEVFDLYMRRLFASGRKYVCIYSCNFEKNHCAHVRCRTFTDWIARHAAGTWELVSVVRNAYPYDENDPDNTSWSDFYFYKKKSKRQRIRDALKKFYPAPTQTAYRLTLQTQAEIRECHKQMEKEIATVAAELAAVRNLIQSQSRQVFVRTVPEHIVVSLTTYPARFGSVCHTLRSLLNQTLSPNRIVVWLDCAENDITDEMRSFVQQGITYRFGCEDLKPHKKYFYALQEFQDSIVITTDDDVIYAPTMIETLYHEHLNHPGCVVANRVHRMRFSEDGTVLPYNAWEYECTSETEPGHDLFATGVGGILYPPHILPPAAFDSTAIKTLCLTADDIWLKCMELIAGVKVVWAANQCVLPPFVPDSQHVGLCKQNRDEGNMNDVQLANMVRQYGGSSGSLPLRATREFTGGGTNVE